MHERLEEINQDQEFVKIQKIALLKDEILRRNTLSKLCLTSEITSMIGFLTVIAMDVRAPTLSGIAFSAAFAGIFAYHGICAGKKDYAIIQKTKLENEVSLQNTDLSSLVEKPKRQLVKLGDDGELEPIESDGSSKNLLRGLNSEDSN